MANSCLKCHFLNSTAGIKWCSAMGNFDKRRLGSYRCFSSVPGLFKITKKECLSCGFFDGIFCLKNNKTIIHPLVGIFVDTRHEHEKCDNWKPYSVDKETIEDSFKNQTAWINFTSVLQSISVNFEIEDGFKNQTAWINFTSVLQSNTVNFKGGSYSICPEFGQNLVLYKADTLGKFVAFSSELGHSKHKNFYDTIMPQINSQLKSMGKIRPIMNENYKIEFVYNISEDFKPENKANWNDKLTNLIGAVWQTITNIKEQYFK
ncbi:hypothetical protein AGMMS50255_3290 [Spirochaetia bacterium]|nr:hypothetical protein AGMMS50255_3290 [Spirochaetia bacterium]